MKALSIRNAEPADASALAEVQRGIYAEGRWFVGDGPPAAETLRQRFRTHDPSRSLYLVALSGSEVVGWLELHRLLPKKLEHVAVLTLAVAAPYRRQGAAGGLLQRAYPWAQRNGVHKLQLSVRAGNSAAQRLYEREGFVLEGCEREQIRDGETLEDNLLMAKFL